MPESEDRNDVPPAPEGNDESRTRRAFVQAGVGAFGACYAGAIVYPIYRYLDTPAQRAAEMAAVTEVVLEGYDTLKKGTAKTFRFGFRPAVLIHQKDDSWTAFDAVCTHLGCTVKYEADKDRIYCACHGGVYNAETGEVEAGPPPKGLTQYSVEVKDGEVVVSRG